MKREKKFGFSLIELMAVVAMIGVLSVVAIPVYKNYVVRTTLSQVVNIVTPYQQAVQLYYQLHGSAPTSAAQLNFTGTGNTIDSSSGQLPLSNIINKIVFSNNGVDPTINFYIPVANIGLSPVSGVSTIILTYELSNNTTTNLLQWSCTFTQGNAEFINFIPAGCT